MYENRIICLRDVKKSPFVVVNVQARYKHIIIDESLAGAISHNIEESDPCKLAHRRIPNCAYLSTKPTNRQVQSTAIPEIGTGRPTRYQYLGLKRLIFSSLRAH